MKKLLVIMFILSLSACNTVGHSADKRDGGSLKIANPASVKCIEDGHRLEIRKDEEGNEYGVCIDKKGSECEEWKYFRGECTLLKASGSTPAAGAPASK